MPIKALEPNREILCDSASRRGAAPAPARENLLETADGGDRECRSSSVKRMTCTPGDSRWNHSRSQRSGNRFTSILRSRQVIHVRTNAHRNRQFSGRFGRYNRYRPQNRSSLTKKGLDRGGETTIRALFCTGFGSRVRLPTGGAIRLPITALGQLDRLPLLDRFPLRTGTGHPLRQR